VASIPISDRELFRNAYVVVSMDAAGQVVRVVRTAHPYETLDALERSMKGLVGVLDQLGRQGRVLLMDSRAARGRHDAEFDEAMAKWRPEVYRQFVRVAVLVESATGVLHARRWARLDQQARLVGVSESELLDQLRASLR
jgi:hypothetical protein